MTAREGTVSLREAEVFAQFTGLAGLTPGEAEAFRPLCATAVRQLNSLMRPGAREDGLPFLEEAAAVLAFYRWTMRGAAAGLDAFSAGGLQITPNGKNVEFARMAWRDAQAAAAPWLCDTEFLFAGVPA